MLAFWTAFAHLAFMRYSRLFLREQGDHFHVVSRIVDRRFVLGEREKEVFYKRMRKLEAFAGVQVLTYCLMDNHVHLLLRTERIEGEAIGDEELIERVEGMYSCELGRELRWQLETWRKQKNAGQVKFWRERYLSRLGNLSEFMRVLKNMFTKWYNAENERVGTLWEERYKVVLVEESARVLLRVGAYIDLNPVRAGMVGDPGEYRWSGYGEALGVASGSSRKGRAAARAGVVRMAGSAGIGERASGERGTGGKAGNGGTDGKKRVQSEGTKDGSKPLTWREAGPVYREILFSEGVKSAGRRTEGGKGKKRGAIAKERAEEVLARRGALSWGELVRQRVRHFTEGVVLGSREFVDSVFSNQPEGTKGKRKTGARKMRGGDWGMEGGLHALRDLRREGSAHNDTGQENRSGNRPHTR